MIFNTLLPLRHKYTKTHKEIFLTIDVKKEKIRKIVEAFISIWKAQLFSPLNLTKRILSYLVNFTFSFIKNKIKPITLRDKSFGEPLCLRVFVAKNILIKI